MPKLNRLLALFMLLLTPAGLQAAMYKWVDENGETHYTQEPPPGDIQAEQVKPPPSVDSAAAQKELDELQKGLDSSREGRQKEAKTAAEEQEWAAAKEEKCELSRQRLQNAERPRTDFVDPDGTERRATEEERQQQMTAAQAQVMEFCE